MSIVESWKRHRFGLALVALLVIVFFAPPLINREVFTFRDHSDYFQPLRFFTAVHLASWTLPYWNPYSASGEPWLANPQIGLFYPPTWLFAFLPFPAAYMLYLALHLAILGWGAYLLFARFGSEGAAMAGAAAVMFSGPVISLVDISNNLASFAWLPLVIWCGVSRVRPELAALVLALAFLGGEPFFASIAALIYVVVTIASAIGRGDSSAATKSDRLLDGFSRIAIAGAGAFGLSAVQLLPFAEMLRGSDRAAGLTREQIFTQSMALGDWVRVAFPPRFSTGALDPNLSQHFIPVVYVGMLVVALAIAGVIAGRRRAAGWLVLLIGAIVVAGGDRVPPTGAVFTHLPLTLFRYPSRVVPFGALAIAALAAIGWDRIRPRRRWLDLLLVLLIVADLVPREQPLFATGPFTAERIVPYPVAIGRVAKMIRINTRPMTNRSAWVSGYLNLYQRRFDGSTAAPLATERYMELQNAAVGEARLDLLGFMGVGFVLSDLPLPDLGAVARSGPVIAYENRGVLPMATFWSRARRFTTAQEAMSARIHGSEPASLEISPHADPRLATARPMVIGARSLILDAHHAELVIDAPFDGIVMLTQQDAPAWHVYVDGVEREKLLAAGVFRAVSVSKGRHEIIWRYRSRALSTGMAMTCITAAALLLNTFVKRFMTSKFSA